MFTVEQERAALLERVVRIFAVVGLFAYVPSMIACIVTGLLALGALDSVAYLLVLLAAFLPRVSYRVKLFAIIGALFTVGVAVLLWTGPLGAGYLWILCGVLISALFGSRRVIGAAFGLAALALAVYGVLVTGGLLNHTFPPIALFVIFGNMIAIAIALSYVIHSILGTMQYAMRRQEVLDQELHHRVKNNLQVTLSLISLEAYDARPSPSLVALERRVRILTAVNELFLANPDSLGMDVRAVVRAVASCAQQWTIVAEDGLDAKTDRSPFEMDSSGAAHFAIGVGELVNLLAPNTVFLAAVPRSASAPPRIRVTLPSDASDGVFVEVGKSIEADATVSSLLGAVTYRTRPGEGSLGPGFEIDAAI